MKRGDYVWMMRTKTLREKLGRAVGYNAIQVQIAVIGRFYVLTCRYKQKTRIDQKQEGKWGSILRQKNDQARKSMNSGTIRLN